MEELAKLRHSTAGDKGRLATFCGLLCQPVFSCRSPFGNSMSTAQSVKVTILYTRQIEALWLVFSIDKCIHTIAWPRSADRQLVTRESCQSCKKEKKERKKTPSLRVPSSCLWQCWQCQQCGQSPQLCNICLCFLETLHNCIELLWDKSSLWDKSILSHWRIEADLAKQGLSECWLESKAAHSRATNLSWHTLLSLSSSSDWYPWSHSSTGITSRDKQAEWCKLSLV